MFLESQQQQLPLKKSVSFRSGGGGGSVNSNNPIDNQAVASSPAGMSPGTFERPLSRLARNNNNSASSPSANFYPMPSPRGTSLFSSSQENNNDNNNNNHSSGKNERESDDTDQQQKLAHQQQLRSSLFSFSSSTSALTPCQPPPSQPFRALDPNWVRQNPHYEKPKYFQPGLKPVGCVSDEQLVRHAHQLDGDMLAMDRALVVESLDALAASVDEYPDQVGPSFALTQAVNAKRKNVLNNNNNNKNKNGSNTNSYQSPFVRQNSSQIDNVSNNKQRRDSTNTSNNNSVDATTTMMMMDEFSPTTTAASRLNSNNNKNNQAITLPSTTSTPTVSTTNEPPVYFLSIELEKGKLGSVALRPDSNCAEIAKDFVLRHDLDENRVLGPLTKYLQEELRGVLKSLGHDNNSSLNNNNFGKKHVDPNRNEASGIRSYLQKHAASSRNQPSFSRPLKRFVSEDDEEILVEDDDDDINDDENEFGDDASGEHRKNNANSKKVKSDSVTTAIGLLKKATSAKFAYDREARKAIAAAQDAKRLQHDGRSASIQVKRNSGGTATFRSKGRDDELRQQKKEAATKKEEEKRQALKDQIQQRASSSSSSAVSGAGGRKSANKPAGDQLLYAYPVISQIDLKIGNNNNNTAKENGVAHGGNKEHFNIFNHSTHPGHGSGSSNHTIPPRRLNYWEQEIHRADQLLKSGGGTNAALEADRKKKAAIQILQKRSQKTIDYLLMSGKSTQAKLEAQAKAAAAAAVAAASTNVDHGKDEEQENDKVKNNSNSGRRPSSAAVGAYSARNNPQHQSQPVPASIGDRLYGQALQQSLRLAKLRSEAKHKHDQEISSIPFKPEIHASPKNNNVHANSRSPSAGGVAAASSSSVSPKLSSEERELKENCTFKPKVDSKSNDLIQQQQQQSSSGRRNSTDFFERMQQKEQEAAEKLEERRKYLASTDPATGQPYFVPTSRK